MNPFTVGLLFDVNPNVHAESLIVKVLIELILQLFTDLTVTDPFIVVDGYDTVILVVPCPDNIVAPAGAVHNNDVAFDGKDAIVYVYTLFGQVAVLITSIAPGNPALNVEIERLLDPLDPQPFAAITDTVPVVNPAGYLKLTALVPWPDTLVAPTGNVHV